MEIVEDQPAQHASYAFVGSVVAVCLVVFVVIARSALPASPDAAPTLSPSQVIALAEQATFRVSAASCGSRTLGSAVVIDGRLITNAHVADGSTEVKVDQPIDPVLVPLLGIDSGSDLAMAEQPAGVSLVLASAASVRGDEIAGRQVVLAGHADGGRVEVQAGVVTGRVPGRAYGYRDDILLIDAPTRAGYSGGPVLDQAGNLVALLSGFDRSTGLSLAIPADVVGQFVQEHREARSSDFAPLISGDCS